MSATKKTLGRQQILQKYLTSETSKSRGAGYLFATGISDIFGHHVPFYTDEPPSTALKPTPCWLKPASTPCGFTSHTSRCKVLAAAPATPAGKKRHRETRKKVQQDRGKELLLATMIWTCKKYIKIAIKYAIRATTNRYHTNSASLLIKRICICAWNDRYVCLPATTLEDISLDGRCYTMITKRTLPRSCLPEQHWWQILPAVVSFTRNNHALVVR